VKALLTVKEMAERYKCSEKTARRYMRSMEHMEKPLRVTEQAVERWEFDRTTDTSDRPVKRKMPRRYAGNSPIIISRVRPKEARA
jgi:DeoR/GlpR family transcriptional regulator of sugar metabolism